MIKDELGATIVGATVTITDGAGWKRRRYQRMAEGIVFNGLAPGKYFVRATALGFAVSEDTEVDMTAGQRQTSGPDVESYH